MYELAGIESHPTIVVPPRSLGPLGYFSLSSISLKMA
jgi:hypothetical protein